MMEKREITCICCPTGCALMVETENGEVTNVTGNTCPRGETYGRKEVTNPTRIVTSIVPVRNGRIPMVSVKTASDIPKGKIAECISELKGITMQAPVRIGDVVAENIAETGVNVVATKNNMEKKEYVRLNKFLSDAGVCSRREADRMTEAGRISIDGRQATLGKKVSGEENILVDGTPVKKKDTKVILAYNKPTGIVCSTKNQGNEKNNIVDAVNYPVRVYPVGRLDKDSEGLIFLTNDGEIVNKIMRAGNFHEKEYVVRVEQPVTDAFLEKMSRGVEIPSGKTRPCKVWRTEEKEFHIILTQGMNRQIRYMCDAFSYKVTALKRIRIMNVELGNLKKGEYRELTEAERKELEKMCENSRN